MIAVIKSDFYSGDSVIKPYQLECSMDEMLNPDEVFKQDPCENLVEVSMQVLVGREMEDQVLKELAVNKPENGSEMGDHVLEELPVIDAEIVSEVGDQVLKELAVNKPEVGSKIGDHVLEEL